jgi:hypothetical protein
MFDGAGKLAVDFIGRVESLEADVAALLALLRPRARDTQVATLIRAATMEQAALVGHENRKADPVDPAHRARYRACPKCCAQLGKWYASDLRALGCLYSSASEPPQNCRAEYARVSRLK